MIQKLEELSINAFPALSTILLNGWVTRFADGYSKRANSVNPIYRCTVDEAKNIELCEQLYQKKRQDAVFKLTDCDYGRMLDEILEKRGYAYEAKTNVLLMKTELYEEEKEALDEVVVLRKPTEEWIHAYVRINGTNEANLPTIKKMLEVTIPDTYCACIYKEGSIVAVGLGVAEGDHIGMFDICVSSEQRRNGLGTKIMKGLIRSAAVDGIGQTYLQVVDANEPAKKLYDMLGYEKQYSYWYRVKKLVTMS